MGACRRCVFRKVLPARDLDAGPGCGTGEIDFDQSRVRANRECCAPLEGRSRMTTETILIVGAITAAFAVFALTLWRAERLTRDLKRE